MTAIIRCILFKIDGNNSKLLLFNEKTHFFKLVCYFYTKFAQNTINELK
jgi:hypothetical protein